MGPQFLARLQFLADPTGAIGVAVQVTIDADHAAMVILHHLVRVERLDRVAFAQANGLAADTVASGHIDDTVLINGRRNHSHSSWKILLPEHRTILG